MSLGLTSLVAAGTPLPMCTVPELDGSCVHVSIQPYDGEAVVLLGVGATGALVAAFSGEWFLRRRIKLEGDLFVGCVLLAGATLLMAAWAGHLPIWMGYLRGPLDPSCIGCGYLIPPGYPNLILSSFLTAPAALAAALALLLEPRRGPGSLRGARRALVAILLAMTAAWGYAVGILLSSMPPSPAHPWVDLIRLALATLVLAPFLQVVAGAAILWGWGKAALRTRHPEPMPL